ncbi:MULTISPECIES: hypothetical protein [Aerococcus]|uniref:Uncharacterized protein n=3 Tax=Aerococcus TaxID=1375 RepID=A0A1E9PHL0_9LACT|nr:MULTISPECIES: hypothetical protein [Aerococcus]MCY3034023.1 hypothetical protein [Aerococcus mictus]MCY3065791.1 hypothetical protein [Aerococcus mictus]MCY3066453.1 hypothetical protein [Aerococcus mictus]MCY3071378.1 hypothetical protein [Aerococcus mictus]MCY3074131.1 hypothetical protein [Aerococcus mictus]
MSEQSLKRMNDYQEYNDKYEVNNIYLNAKQMIELINSNFFGEDLTLGKFIEYAMENNFSRWFVTLCDEPGILKVIETIIKERKIKMN